MEITLIKDINRSYFEGLIPKEAEEVWDIEIGAMEDGQPCGILLADHKADKINIRFFLVDMDYWGLGAGTSMLNALRIVALENDIDFITISFEEGPGNRELEAFLEGYGFTAIEHRGIFYETRLSQFKDFVKYVRSRKVRIKSKIVPLKYTDLISWNAFVKRINREGRKKNSFLLRPHFIDEKSTYDQELSLLLMNSSGSITGCILIMPENEGFEVAYACNLKQEPVETMLLMCTAIEQMLQSCPGDTIIYANCVENASAGITEKILKNHVYERKTIVTMYTIPRL